GIDPSLRIIIDKYERFFASKERIRRLKSLNITDYTQEKIELGMLNVLCKTYSVDFEPVLRKVLMDTLDDDANIYLSEINKYFSFETFWHYVSRHYGYHREEQTLKSLFIHLVMTAATRTINEDHLEAYKPFIAKENQTHAYVFIDHWMNHSKDQTVYNEYIKSIEQELKIPEVLNELLIEEYIHSEVFPYVDQAIITYIGNSLKNDEENFEHYLNLIQTRRTKHFYQIYRPIYEALHYAVKLY